MPPIGPIKTQRPHSVSRGAGGFSDPFSGGKHRFMKGRGKKVRLPNPHHSDLTRGLLLRILRNAGIRRDEWEALT
jgi:predicted RNA binding protein YcfA (HicA-like mRNA interferase family)